MIRVALAAALCAACAGLALPSGAAAASTTALGMPRHVAAPLVAPTDRPCAVDVARFLDVRNRSNDTAAFDKAISVAVTTAPSCFAHGPDGSPQAVVYVPAGTYRLQKLHFVSNLRMEVDAGATLQEPVNRPGRPTKHEIPMFVWDTPHSIGAPLTNVSLVGVGSAMTAQKNAALTTGGRVLDRFSVQHDFTMNLDPRTTGSTNYNPGMYLVNVTHFVIRNVFSIQNGTNAVATHITRWPTSARAVFMLHASDASPLGRPPYIQPKFGVIANQVNVHSPRGFGPNQVNAAYRVQFRNIYSQGGTALRIETDGSMGPHGVPDRGARVQFVTGRNIVGVDCNRAVSLSPHAQRNGLVRVHGVWAYSCTEAVVANIDRSVPRARQGRFRDARVYGVHALAGRAAQLDSTRRLWVVGRSYKPVVVARGMTWHPVIRVVRSVGDFAA